MMLFLPDMCTSSFDTCWEHEQGAVSEAPTTCYVFFSRCLTTDKCGMTRMHGQRKTRIKGHYMALLLIIPICFLRAHVFFIFDIYFLTQKTLSVTGQLSSTLLTTRTSSVTLNTWIVSPLCLCISLLRLGVSQRVPGVCGSHCVCSLAGGSVWRLYLVPT